MPDPVEIAATALWERYGRRGAGPDRLDRTYVQAVLDALAEAGYHLLTPAEHQAMQELHDLVQRIQDNPFGAFGIAMVTVDDATVTGEVDGA